MGNATGPVAESGGSPDSRSTEISLRKTEAQIFRRAAENCRGAACAPGNISFVGNQ